MGRVKYYNGTAWVEAAPSASEYDTFKTLTLNKSGGTMSGALGLLVGSGRQFFVNSWGDMSVNTNGYALFSNNAYTDGADTYRYSNTHANLGARGIRLSIAYGIEYFDTGSTATTAGVAFTPVWKKLWHAGNDGSGSGLDADLLRGKVGLAADGSVAMTGVLYLSLGGALGEDGGGTFIAANNNTFNVLTESGSAYVLQVNYASPAPLFKGNTMWHAGNDGAGSGLDADLLAGFGAAYGPSGNTVAVRESDGKIRATLGIFTGQVEAYSDGTAIDAALHIKNGSPGTARFTQMHWPSADVNKNALNLIASKDASGNQVWWSWGVDSSGYFRINVGTTLTTGGLALDTSGNGFLGNVPIVKGTIFKSTAAPSGGADGDIWMQYS